MNYWPHRWREENELIAYSGRHHRFRAGRKAACPRQLFSSSVKTRFPGQPEMERWNLWFSKITGRPAETPGSVVGATPLTQHRSGGVGLRSACHLCVPLGGTVSTSQEAFVSRDRQKRLLSTLSLSVLNRCWALTRIWIKAPTRSFWGKHFLVFLSVVFFNCCCFLIDNELAVWSVRDFGWLVMFQPATVENCCQLSLNCPKSETHPFAQFIWENSS